MRPRNWGILRAVDRRKASFLAVLCFAKVDSTCLSGVDKKLRKGVKKGCGLGSYLSSR